MALDLSIARKTGYKEKLLSITATSGLCIARDSFNTAIATGLIDGTDCEPGPSTRTAVDTDGKMSIGA